MDFTDITKYLKKNQRLNLKKSLKVQKRIFTLNLIHDTLIIDRH